MGLSTQEFYSLTPRQFGILVGLYHDRIEHQELLNGMVCQTIVNWGPKTPRGGVSAKEFMPCKMELEAPKKVPKRTRANGQRVSQQISQWLEGLKGQGLVVEQNG